jgi:hypothetical protein
VGGQVVEDHVDPLGELRIAGQQAQVCVEAGSIGVVVARAQMTVAAGYAVLVAADEHGQLAMSFEADDAMKNLDAGILHAARPTNVRGFIKTGHQLNDQGGLLIGGGLSERLEHRRVVAGAIEGLFHADHGRVRGALLNEIHYKVIGVVRGGGAGCRGGAIRRRCCRRCGLG